MAFNLYISNIVVLATTHNPSILSEEWLDKYQIIPRAKLVIRTPELSIMESEQLHMVGEAQRIQFSAKKFDADTIKSCANAALKYLETLPHIPYRAIGYNFHYVDKNSQRSFPVATRISGRNIGDILSLPLTDQGFVVYWQDQEARCRLSLEIGENKRKEMIFNFNFEPLPEGSNSAIKNLSQFEPFFSKSKELVQLLDSNWGG
jgi:hypothetical protein